MSDEPEATAIGSLPHSRPQRRSDERAARPEVQRVVAAATTPKTKTPPETKTPPKPKLEEPASPPAPQPTGCRSSVSGGMELLGTVVMAAAELAEIGLTVGARALRTAVSRLPRP